jgi:flagellar hook assembly protein FlgD
VISYPNPFNPTTQSSNIAYRLAQDADVKIYIYDLSGALIRLIATNSASRASDGYSRYAWDGKNGYGAAVDNGTYIVRVVSGGNKIGFTKIMAVR